MADKKDSINPIATKEVDYLDPELATKKEKKSLKDTARDVKFWSKIMGKLLKLVGKAIVSLVKAFIAGLPWTLLIPIVIILIGFALALQSLPGMMQAKLKNFIKNMQNEVQSWFMTDAEAALDDMDYSDIVNIANYIEEMGYDLIGDGFVVPELDRLTKYPTFDELIDSGNFEYELGEDNGWHLFENGVIWEGDFTNSEGEVYDCDGIYFNTLGIPVSNKTNQKLTDAGITYKDKYGIIRSTTEKNANGDGVLVTRETFSDAERNSIELDNLKNYRLLKTYLLSDYRIFTLRNNDTNNILKSVYANIQRMFGSYQDAWSKGLMNVYTAEKGIAKQGWGFVNVLTGDSVKIDRETVSLKNGYGNKPINYKIAGWLPRYGLSLDFLLSLHLGTAAPDLVYAMVQNFDTEIQVYLEDSGKSRVDAKYLDPRAENDAEATLKAVETSLKNGESTWSNISGFFLDTLGDNHYVQDWVNALILTKRNCMTILKDYEEVGIISPKNCTGGVTDYAIEYDTYSGGSYYEDILGDDNTDRNILKNKYNYTDSDLENIDLEYYEQGGDPKHYNAATLLQSVKYSSEYNSFSMGSSENEKEPEQSALDEALTKAFDDRDKSHDKLQEAKINLEDNVLNYKYENNIETTDQYNPNIKYRIEKSSENYEGMVYGWFDEATEEWHYGTEQEYNAKEGGHEWEDTSIEYYSYIYKIYKTVTGEETPPTTNTETPSTGKVLRAELTLVYSSALDDASVLGPVKGEAYVISIYENEEGKYELVASKDGVAEPETACQFVIDKMGDGQVWNFLPSKISEEYREAVGIQIFINCTANFVYADENYSWLDVTESKLLVEKPYETTAEAEENGTSPNDGNTVVLNQEYQIDVCYVTVFVRDRSFIELQHYGIIDEHGVVLDEDKCYKSSEETKTCCSNCQRYVKAVVQALADISDQDFRAYTPYIARVVGSWFRDTYFVVPDDNVDDAAINGYKEQHKEFDTSKVMGDSVKFVKVDEEYLSDTGEYWSSYEMKEDNPEEYQLFYLNSDGTTSDTKMEDFLQEEHTYKDNDGNQVTKKFANQKEAEDAGFAFVKKAKLYDVKDFAENESSNMQNGDNGLDSNILWSAYSFAVTENTSDWDRVNYGDNSKVDKVYEINWGKSSNSDDGDDGGDDDEDEDGGLVGEDTTKGVFFRIMTSNQVTQQEDAQRGETNALIKYLFKYRRYYIYDGTKETAVRIEKDRQRVIDEVLAGTISGFRWSEAIDDLNLYGRSALRDAYSWATITFSTDKREVAEQWIEWQLDMYYMDKYGVDLKEYYNTNKDLLKITKDPRDQDLVNTVNITKSSLNAFSILENTGTVDAEYQYRDFKELIVELNYFDKEDLSEKPDSIFTWILPETSPMGWPNRIYDKQDVEYGALVQSKATYANLKGEELPVSEETEGEEGTGGEGTTPETTNPTEGSVDGEGGGTVPSVSTAPNTPLNPVTTVVGDPVTDDTPNTGEDENPPAETDNPQDNNNPQDENPSEDENQTPSVDETKIVFIGDSWTVGLQENNIPKSSYVYGRSGENAKDFLDTPQAIPSDASAIVIEFGLNDPAGATKTQELATKLKSENSGVPIFILAAPHVTSDYSGNIGANADEANAKLDEYSNQLKTFCESNDGITFINPTGAILENGYLKYNSGTYHLTPEGYKIWYDAIIAEINNNSSSTDNGSTGKAVFEGWEAEQLVASPVTGKVLEYGTHTRMNIHTGKEEKVGYIIIEPLTEGSDANGNGTKTGYFTDEMVGSVEYTPPEDSDGFDVDTAAKALNLFYKEYDTNCAGYTIMIDGFNVDLQTVDENDNAGAYEKNDVVALYNSKEEKKRIAMEQAKENAPFFINNGESSIPTMEEGYHAPDSFTGLYVKEGKYIGKTTEPSSIEVLDTITPESVISEYEGPADYIRILIKDLDYSVVDNVEDFFNIPEPGFGDSGEGITGVDQEYQAEPGDLELLADAIHHESGGGACSTYEEKLYVATSMGYTIINKLNSDSEFDSGYPLDWAPGKSKLYNLLALIPSDGKSRSGWYGISRAPQEGDSCGNTFRYRADNNCLNYHNEEWVLEAAKYCLQYDSLNFKCIDTFGDGTDFTAGESMPHTCWEQGTGGTVNLPGNKFWRRHQNYTSDNFFILAEHNH